MGDITTNLSLYKPAVDEEDWGANVNSNFDTLDILYQQIIKPVEIIQSVFQINLDSGFQVLALGSDISDDIQVKVNLPVASGSGGQTIWVKLQQLFTDGGDVTIVRSGGNTLDNTAADLTATAATSFIVLISDGVSDWMIFGNSGFA